MNEENNNEEIFHAIYYSDGSAGPNNPGGYGTGLHGYVYNENKLGSKSGDRPSKYHITNIGYVENGQMDKDIQTVIPEYYIDGYISNALDGTNNVGEIDGVLYAIRDTLSSDLNIKTILVKTDSTYTMGVFQKVKLDDQRTWDNQSTANHNKYLEAEYELKELESRGIKLSIIKVLAHSTSLGNNTADRLAFLGRNNSNKYRESKVNIQHTTGKYWKLTEEKHPFINYKQLFFMRGVGSENFYCVLNYAKDEEVGRKSNTATFGLVKLSEPIEKVENIITTYNNYLNSLSLISSINMVALYSQRALLYEKLFGNDIYIPNLRGRKFLTILEEDVVCSEIYPPGLAKNALDKTMLLNNVIADYEEDKNIFKYIDITDKVYGVDAKGKPNTILAQNDICINVDIPDIGNIPIKIGDETLTRNQFKKLEKNETKVYFVYNLKSKNSLEYWSLIDSVKTGDKAIYTNFYTNTYFFKGK